MPFFAIIDTANHFIIANYYSEEKDLTKPGLSYDQTKLLHLTVPEDFVNEHHVKVVYDTNQNTYHFETDINSKELALRDQWDFLRQKRNEKLAKTDWIVMAPDSNLSEDKKQQWIIYRKELRDLPSNTTDPANPIWPIEPVN